MSTTVTSYGHDVWSNNAPVPRWVKASCCGPHDVHQLTLAQVSRERGGWRVDGLDMLVPDTRTFPSEDGYVWGFWVPDAGRHAVVQCLFIPMSF